MRFISPMFRSSLPSTQRGSMLIIGLFILLVLGALGTSLVNMLQSEGRSSTYEVFSVRATETARIGVDTMFAQLFPLSADSQGCDEIGASQSLDISTVSGLEGCSVSMVCTDSNINGDTYYQVTARASCGAGSGADAFLVEREIVAEAKTL